MEDTVTIEVLKKSGYEILQDKKKFCFGVDAVLLADFAETKKGNKIADLGTGTGIIPILMYTKNPDAEYFGLEIQEEFVQMASASICRNNLEKSIHILQGDIKSVFDKLEKNSFDVVVSNPPYMTKDNGKQNLNEAKTIARHEVLCTLNDVIKSASGLLKSKGKFYLIHRPHRLSEIFKAMSENKLEPKKIRFVYPHIDDEPEMVLIEAVKGAKSFLRCCPPLIMYEKNNSYTLEMEQILNNTL